MFCEWQYILLAYTLLILISKAYFYTESLNFTTQQQLSETDRLIKQSGKKKISSFLFSSKTHRENNSSGMATFQLSTQPEVMNGSLILLTSNRTTKSSEDFTQVFGKKPLPRSKVSSFSVQVDKTANDAEISIGNLKFII